MNKLILPLLLLALSPAGSRAALPDTQPDAPLTGLPHIHVDIHAKQVAVDCQALNVSIPLEFFCVIDGGNEHESVLRTPAKPSDIHFALLMLGLKPGAPATFLPRRRLWLAPHGPPLRISCTYVLNGKSTTVPAYRMMRSLKTKKEMPPCLWVFDGSRIMPDGVYAADVTGYVVSICNFDLTMIDVPTLVSNSNQTLQWEYNPNLVPPKGVPVTMVIEPAGPNDLPLATQPATQPAALPADQFDPGPGLTAQQPESGPDTAPAER